MLDALGEIEGARRHLGQLMVDELHAQVPNDSVVRMPNEQGRTSERLHQDIFSGVGYGDLEKVAANVRSDIERVCILLFKQEIDRLERQKIKEAKNFLSKHSI